MANNVLSQQYVDIVARGLEKTLADLKALQGQADRSGQALRKVGGGGGAGGGAGGLLGGMGGGAMGALARVAAPAAIGAGAVTAVKAADPAVFERLGVIMHDIAGTVGQVLAPAFDQFVPILRTVGDVIAGVADAFRPITDTIISTLMPVVSQLAKLFGEQASVVGGIVMPVVVAFSSILKPLGEIFTALVRAFMPIGQAVLMFQAVVMQVVVSVISLVLPYFKILAEIMGAVGTVVGEVASVFFDLFQMLSTAVGELLAPMIEFRDMIVNGIVSAIKIAVGIFKSLVDVVRGIFGIQRRPIIGAADSVGRGMYNQTGTEDAMGTFARIQEAILKSATKSEEEKQTDHLASIDEQAKRVKELMDKFVDPLVAWLGGVKQGAESAGTFAEGALNLAMPLPMALTRVFTGR